MTHTAIKFLRRWKNTARSLPLLQFFSLVLRSYLTVYSLLDEDVFLRSPSLNLILKHSELQIHKQASDLTSY